MTKTTYMKDEPQTTEYLSPDRSLHASEGDLPLQAQVRYWAPDGQREELLCYEAVETADVLKPLYAVRIRRGNRMVLSRSKPRVILRRQTEFQGLGEGLDLLVTAFENPDIVTPQRITDGLADELLKKDISGEEP
jgi:hypothetical protein